MNREWWEKPACYICDYWWLFLLLLIAGLGAYVSRRYWMPAVFPVQAPTPTRVSQLGTGDVQVTLIWNSVNDLDLWVIDPNDTKIYYAHPTSPSGGMLDVDANPGCRNLTTQPVENIFWPHGGAPHGVYRIAVNYYQQCQSIAETEFKVRALVDGQVQEFQGVLNAVGETKEITRVQR